MPEFAFAQVDVFAASSSSSSPLSGNPLAVVHGADSLDDATMQHFARWTNLSETTFLLRTTSTEADYRVRIFTPGGELPFAGHPTLGTCHAWLEAGGTPRTPGEVVQECGIGLVRIRLATDGDRAAFAAPPLRTESVGDALLLDVLRALGLPREAVREALLLDHGPVWLGLLLDSAARVLAIEPDHAALKHLAKVGVIGPYEAGAPCDFEVRAFAAPIGIPEDPVTGSLNASLAQWLISAGHAPARYLAAQGARVGRGGRVAIERDTDGTVWVGGRSITRIRGTLSL